MSAQTDKREYLKKYLSEPKSNHKKKEKKKKHSKRQIGMRLIEDNYSLSNIPYGFHEEEDAPTIAKVTYENKKAKELDEMRNLNKNKWKNIDRNLESNASHNNFGTKKFESGLLSKTTHKKKNYDSNNSLLNRTNQGSDNSPPRKKRHDSDNSLLSRRGHGSDNSPPIRERRDSDSSPPRIEKHDSYNSRPRRKKHGSDSSPRRERHDSDNSPPKKRGHNSDNSPPRRKRHDSDNSPKRKRHDSDSSPPKRKRHGSDSSPPRRKRHDSDNSPPKRKRHDSDNSPPRRKRHDSDNSIPRRKRHDSDNSPPRRKRRDSDNSIPRRKRHDSDNSPPRRKRHDSDISPPRKNHSFNDTSPSGQKGQHIKTKIDSKEFLKMRRTGKLKKDTYEESLRKERESKYQKEAEEKHKRWNKGIVQTELHKQKISDTIHEMGKSFARSADDKDMNDKLKEVLLDDDPMKEYIIKKRIKESNITQKPIYQGSFMPNRFNIRPGFRWDGVDRSSGYENDWFNRQNSRVAADEEMYKWSTEDM